ncbi:hypothetical protein PInf_029110 [Phytophthora infestans]|nr:hypothetical protein PInf_029110 [Phytophthora infestans]
MNTQATTRPPVLPTRRRPGPIIPYGQRSFRQQRRRRRCNSGDEPWTATSARTTNYPPPLRTSKRAAHRGTTAAALTEARKGKKKATKRTPAASTGRKKPGDGEDNTPSDQELEDKVAPPKSKRSKKAPASTEVPATSVQLPASSFPEATSTRQGFNLTSFMASFDPGHATVTDTVDTPESRLEGEAGEVAATTPRGPGTEVMTELRALREGVVRLRLLHGHNGVGRNGATPAIVTAPNSKGELPPPDVRFLTSSSFQEGSKKTKGDYNPPQAHLLGASRMFRDFGMNSGKITSAMSFVLRRDGMPGRGSTNANFSSDFGPSAGLPTVGVECGSYEDILDAIHGLNALGQDVWYDYMQKLTSRLRVFVSKNKSADPDTMPVRVRLTLMYVKKFLGSALAYMQDDNTQWWILPREQKISPEVLRFANEILSSPADVHPNLR